MAKAKITSDAKAAGSSVTKPTSIVKDRWRQEEIGQAVRTRRLALKMSQEMLAEKLGLTFQQVQKYEKGTNRIAASRLEQICDILGVPVTRFIGKDTTNLTADEQAILGKLRKNPDLRIVFLAFPVATPAEVSQSIITLLKQRIKPRRDPA